MPDVTNVAAAIAHGPVGAGDSAWPTVMSVLALCAIGTAYGKGVQDLWTRRGVGAVISVPRTVAFTGGLATLLLAVVPPVDRVAQESFTGHMVQHMIMLVVAGPLLGFGGVALPLTLALPHPARRWLARLRASAVVLWLRRPAFRTIVGGLLFVTVLWAWHLPASYALAERSDVVHAVQHASYVLIAWLLWAAVLAPGRHRLNGPLAFLLLFAIGMAGAALGAVLTFAPVPLYPSDVLRSDGALADQQLAGLVMWIPMDVVVMGLALGIFGRWLIDLDRRYPGKDPAMSQYAAAEVMPR